MSGKRLRKKIRNEITEIKEDARKRKAKRMKQIFKEKAELRNIKIIYRKRLVSNYLIIPALFILIAQLCSQHPRSIFAAFIIFASMIIHGTFLFVHHNERIRKGENAKQEGFEFASSAMQIVSYIIMTYTVIACAAIILFC